MYSVSQNKDVHKALLEKREKEYLSSKKKEIIISAEGKERERM